MYILLMLLSRSSFKISKLKNVAYHIEYQILYKGKIFKHCSFLHEVNKLLKYVQVLDHGWPIAASDLLDPIYETQMTSPGLWISILTSDLDRLGRPWATSEFQTASTASKRVSWKPGRKKIQPRKIWAQFDKRNTFNIG